MTMLPEFLSRPVLQKSIGKGRGEKMPSFHIDLYQGRGKSEVGYLNGAVVRYAEKCGLQAPVNQFLTETLTQLTNKDLPLSTYANNPDRYYQEFTQLMGAQAR
jgi:2-dehydropantoate 2-reductase